MAKVINTINKGGGTGTTITVVANYSALPDPTTVSGKFYWCSASQGAKYLPGSIGGTYYSAGQYYSNGTTWEFIDVPYQATQTEVNTGTNTDKFVTPNTFANASKWGTKQDSLGYTAEDVSNKTSTITGNETSTTLYSTIKGIVDYFSATKIKSILGISTLSGSNTGDQDLSGLVPITRTVNSKALSSNITLTTTDISDITNKRYVTDANLTTIGNQSGSNTGDETATRIATINHGTSAKTTLVDADEITGQDSASSFSLIRVTCLNLYNYLKTKFDSVYTTTSAVATQITTALSGYATTSYVNSQGFITNVVTSLGYTPEIKSFRIMNSTAYTDLVGGSGLRTMFGISATAKANTAYEFECEFTLSSISASSGTFSFGILGTAGIASIMYNAFATKNTALTNAQLMSFTVTTASILSVSNTASVARAVVKGTFRTNATPGTIIPAYAVSVNANPVTDVNSFFKITEIGADTFTNG